jgi:hypothetical protein
MKEGAQLDGAAGSESRREALLRLCPSLDTGPEASRAGLGQPRRKFALHGLAQSTARELGQKGIHVAHFVIDGGVRSARRPDPADRPDSTLDPEGIAQTYLEVLRQPCSAWSLEVELRPWVETF